MVKSRPSDFEIFEAQTKPKRLADNQVSLTKTNLLISEALAESFGESRRVVLLYNRKTQEIGIRPAEADESGYKLSCRSVSSSSFYRFFGIKARGRFPARLNRFGAIIVSLAPDVPDGKKR